MLVQCSMLGQMLRLGALLEQLQVSRSARFSSRERERQKESWGPFFRWTDVRASTSALPMKWFLWAEDQSSVREFICLVILSHEENILADFYMCYNHTLWC